MSHVILKKCPCPVSLPFVICMSIIKWSNVNLRFLKKVKSFVFSSPVARLHVACRFKEMAVLPCQI